jgi:GTPase Era involved in 16S rRNA processing
MDQREVSRAEEAPAQPLASIELLLALDDRLLGERTRDDLLDGRARLEGARVNAVALGAFKRGKSTLLNALLGARVLPTGVLPLTSVVTVVGHGGRERVVVETEDAPPAERPLSALHEYVTEADNPGNARHVRVVRVELPHPLLEAGLQLVDTPGVASIHGHNTQAARDALGRVDAALCVLAADQPLADAELELFQDVARRAGRIMVLVNRADIVGRQGRDEAMRFIVSGLRAGGLEIADDDVFVVSARTGAGLERLSSALLQLADRDRKQVLGASVRVSVRLAAEELARAATVERSALELPIAELAHAAARLRGRMIALTEARADAEDIMRRRVADAVRERVDEPLMRHARDRRTELDRELDVAIAEQGRCSPSRLAGALDGWVEERVRSEMNVLAPAVERRLGDALARLQERHARAIARILGELEKSVDELLGAPLGASAPELAIREPSRFSFKLSDPEHALEHLLSGARRAAPGALGRRLVARAARDRLQTLVDRHAGRLRSELSARAAEAVEDHARELADVVVRAGETVESALTRAQESARAGEAEASARVAHLRRIEENAMSIVEGATR